MNIVPHCVGKSIFTIIYIREQQKIVFNSHIACTIEKYYIQLYNNKTMKERGG